jgi:hypothetical protein
MQLALHGDYAHHREQHLMLEDDVRRNREVSFHRRGYGVHFGAGDAVAGFV